MSLTVLRNCFGAFVASLWLAACGVPPAAPNTFTPETAHIAESTHALAQPMPVAHSDPYVVAVPGGVSLRDLGRAPATMPVTLLVELKYRQESQLNSLLDAQANHRSPSFGHFLTSRQFAAKFGPSIADFTRTVSLLRRAGFTVTHRYAGGTAIDVIGRAASVERYFNTELHRVSQDGVGVRFVNTRPAVVPAELRVTVDAVDGFSSLSVGHSGLAHAGERPAIPSRIGGPSTGPDGGFGPIAIADGYDYPVQHGFDGTGIAVGFIVPGSELDSDVSTYLAEFGVKRTGPSTKTVKVDGGCTTGCDAVDPTFSAEQIVSLAPGVALYVYDIVADDNKHMEDGLKAIVSDNKVDVAYEAYAECDEDTTFAKIADQTAKAAAALGITLITVEFNALTIDTGCKSAVESPANSPNFLGVGGSSLQENAKSVRISESSETGSGGGVSTTFTTVPKFQKGVAGVQPGGRNTPDIVSGTLVNGVYESIYVAALGGWVGGGNYYFTVDAAPVAALFAEAAQEEKGRLGLVDGAVYGAFRTQGYKGKHPTFYDITTGPCLGMSGAPPCPSKGYDDATGIGSVDGQNLAKPF